MCVFFSVQGAYLWNLKDWIDRKFMAKYGDDLKPMEMMNKPQKQVDSTTGSMPWCPGKC
jgi:hypothetical protein